MNDEKIETVGGIPIAIMANCSSGIVKVKLPIDGVVKVKEFPNELAAIDFLCDLSFPVRRDPLDSL